MHADSLNSSFSTSDSRPASSPPHCSASLSSSLSSPHSWLRRCSSGSADGTARGLRTIRRHLFARGPFLPRRPETSSASTVEAVQSPQLLGVTDGSEALVHPSKCLVE